MSMAKQMKDYSKNWCATNLITKGKDSENVEYVYMHNMIWDLETYKESIVNRYIIVENVEQLPEGGYSFIVKDTGQKCRSNFAWAFAKHTPENNKQLKEFIKADDAYKKAQRIRNKKRAAIKTLEE